eukprot:6200259-Pleurochrysis_carterae.AAC.3
MLGHHKFETELDGGNYGKSGAVVLAQQQGALVVGKHESGLKEAANKRARSDLKSVLLLVSAAAARNMQQRRQVAPPIRRLEVQQKVVQRLEEFDWNWRDFDD